ncbi:MAG: A/G-specific adenine glycosylase [Oscillospiraceae bacterium]|nr:A/G-specific adenine glycosylase [Oscillospiraceae bacterium]
MEKNILAQLPQALLPWYEHSKRDLPWRQDREPYHVWLSEIMLQQTRVEAVKGYYARFLDALPTIEALAACDDEMLHKLWEGLGYYSRVRNLKKAAIQIMQEHGGVFPRKYADVRALPGIGDYTAGAICSICFDAPTPAVDGNVLRVISRLAEDDTPIDLPAYKAQVRDALAEIYPAEAGNFTQSLMELGATLCGPNWKPRCAECPCRDFCGGARHATAENFPVKLPKKGKRVEEKTVFILSCDGRYALEKRPNQGLLAGLWQFPNVENKLETADALAAVEKLGLRPREILRSVKRKHIFTHIRWEMRGIYIEVSETAGDFTWLSAEEIRRAAALPTAFRQFWEEIDNV